MSDTRESRPGANQAAGISRGDTDSLRPSDDLESVRGFIEGVHVVVVETPTGKHRRRVFLSLISAQRAADRAIMSGHPAYLILCQLMPASNGAR